MKVFLRLSDAIGERVPGEGLRAMVAKYDWRHTFSFFATLAASWANGEDAPVQGLVTKPLWESTSRSTDPRDHAIAKLLASTPDPIIVHEELFYFLEALALLAGTEGGAQADPATLAMMALAANDHISQWASPDLATLTPAERMTADLFRLGRYNRFPDPVRELGRASLVYERTPPRPPLSDLAAWEALQRRALEGFSISEYLERFGVMIFMMSRGWGAPDKEGRVDAPMVLVNEWLVQTLLGTQERQRIVDIFRGMSMTRGEAQARLQETLRPDGLPHSPSLFISHPFVEVQPGLLVPSSPTMVREHISGGLWRRLLDACKATQPAEVWHSTFGDMMEMACREVALDAQACPRFRDRVVLSKTIGASDEIEDVVIHGSSGLALFSAKASRIEHAVARSALSRRRVLQWIDAFLFAAKSTKHRGGALRLLNAKVDRIRAGVWSQVPWPTDVPLFPALVSFDDIGDGIGIARVIEQRCAELNLLQQRDVAPVALLSLDDLEGLLALAALGRSVPELLALKASPTRREQPFKSFLLDESRSKHLRLPSLKRRAKDLFQRSMKSLFNLSEPVLDPDDDELE